MSFKSRLLVILLIFIFSLAIALPTSWKVSALKTVGLEKNPFFEWFTDRKVNLGLDLQGGTQLDYKVDLRGVPAKDRKTVIEGVQAVFERRVNGLGVSEPNIYQSTVGDEEHIVVELAGIKDIDEAKKIIGKVIQLEFKEQSDAKESDQKEEIRVQANDTLKTLVNAPEKFETTGNEITKKNRVELSTSTLFADGIPAFMLDELKKLKDNTVAPQLLQGTVPASFKQEGGQLVQVPEQKGYFIVKLTKSEKVLRSDPKNAEDFGKVAKEVSSDPKLDLGYVRKSALPSDIADKTFELSNGSVSDVLESSTGFYIFKMLQKLPQSSEMVRADEIVLKYKDIQDTKPIDESLSAEEKKKLEDENKQIQTANDAANTYNQDELPKKAADLLAKIKANPAKFSQYVQENSEDAATKALGGDMGFFAAGTNAKLKDLEDKAFTLNKGDISEVIKTDLGYHIIRITDKKAANEDVAKVQQIKTDAKTKADAALKRIREETKYTYASIYFSTLPDQWKPALASNPLTKEMESLTGKFFQRADTEYNSQTLEPVVSIKFNDQGAAMFEELTGRLAGKPIAIFVGGDLISAPTVREKIAGGSATISGSFTAEAAAALARDLNAGAIPAPITLAGQEQIGSQLGSDALDASLKAGIWGVLVLIFFLILYYRLPGLVAGLALVVYISIFVAFLKLWPGMVLTLAGIAGVVLSIGMAVDANVLIFERLKEELRAGKTLQMSLKAGFERAWTSIRDSNTSSLFTALILLWFGSSIIKGFAFMLIVGVVFSLFSAIFTTRTFLEIFMPKHPEYNGFMWGLKKKKEDSGQMTGNSKQ